MGVAGWRDPEEGKGREGIISDTGPHGHPYHGPLVESRVLSSYQTSMPYS